MDDLDVIEHHVIDHDGIDPGELERDALAADPDAAIADDAVPFLVDQAAGVELLPEWYMPVPRNLQRTPARMFGAAAIVGALVLVNGAGLCVTYGLPEIAW
jgi:hypothetical protein